MTWIEISIVSSAAAFVVLIVFAVRMLITASQTLGQLRDTAAQAQISVVNTAAQAGAI